MSLADITRELEQIEGVTDAHHVHAWALTSGRYVFSGHVRVADGADPGAVLSAAHRMLKAR